MDPKKPAPAAAPAKSPAASAAEASAGAAATRRLPLGKLAVAGGAGMAAIGLLVGVLVWLWPAGPDPAAAKKAARGAGDSSYGGGGGYGASRGPREMFTATCSSCGQVATVPFRPSGAKPVYCSDCFSRR